MKHDNFNKLIKTRRTSTIFTIRLYYIFLLFKDLCAICYDINMKSEFVKVSKFTWDLIKIC